LACARPAAVARLWRPHEGVVRHSRRGLAGATGPALARDVVLLDNEVCGQLATGRPESMPGSSPRGECAIGPC